MAINRFMKPLERDFSSEQYLPDFAAWSQALQKKDALAEGAFTDLEALTDKIPLAGFATQDARKEWVNRVKQESQSVAENLSKTGDIAGARRAVRRMASDIATNPWASVFEQDRSFMEFVSKMRTMPGFELSVNNYIDEKGNVKQIKDISEWKGDYYNTIMPANAMKEYQEVADMIKPVVEKITKDHPELIVQEDPDTGEKYLFSKNEDTTITKLTDDQILGYLTKDVNGLTLAELTYKNLNGQGRLWDEGTFKKKHGRGFNMSEWMTRLIVANITRTFEHVDTRVSFTKQGKQGGTTGGIDGGGGGDLQNYIASGFESTAIGLYDLPKDARDLYASYQSVDRELLNIDKYNLNSLNSEIKRQISFVSDDPENQPIVKNSQGVYVLNNKLPWTTRVEGQNETLIDRLQKYRNSNGSSYLEEIAGLNAKAEQLKSNKNAFLMVLDQAGISYSDYQKYQDRIEQEKRNYYSNDPDSQERLYNILLEDSERSQPNFREIYDKKVYNTISSRMAISLGETRDMHNKVINKLQKVIDAREDDPVSYVQSRTWNLGGINNKGKDFVEAVNENMKNILLEGVTRGTVKDHYTDKIIQNEKVKNHIQSYIDKFISAEASEELGTGDKAKTNFLLNANVRIKSDPKDGYVGVIRIPGMKTATGKEGEAMDIEFKIPSDYKIHVPGGSMYLTQFIGIESNGERFERTAQIANTWAAGNLYSYQSVTDGTGDGQTVYQHSLQAFNTGYNKDKNARAVSEVYSRINHAGNNYSIILNGGAREAAMLQEVLENAKHIEKTDANINTTKNFLIGELGIDERQAELLANEMTGSNHGVGKPFYLNSNSGYTTKGNRSLVVSQEMKMQMDEFKATVGEDNFLVVQAYRSEEENRKVNGVENSRHKTGNAADLRYTDDLKRILESKYKIKFLKENDYYNIPGTKLWIGIHNEPEKGIEKHFHMELR